MKKWLGCLLNRWRDIEAREGEGGGKIPQPPPAAWRRALALSLGLAGAMSGDAAWAGVMDEPEARRRTLAEEQIVWGPPQSPELVMSEAHWGSPDAPLVFEGGVLHVGGSFTTQREFRVSEQAVVNTHDDAVLTIAGPVTRVGASRQGLAKLGAGTLRLAGRNSYDGNTLLLQGGLDVLDGGALGASYRTLNVNTGTRLRYAPGVVVGNSIQLQAEPSLSGLVPPGSYDTIVPAEHADSVQWFVDGGEAVQVGMMAGSAPIVKQGSGLLRLAGPAVAYGGPFTVNQGALAVDDVFWGPVRVNAGARLEGVGQVGDTTIGAGGTLAPGNSVGALSVRGNLVFEPGSRFEVEATPFGAADRVRVSGTAALDGRVAVLAEAGDWGEATRYTVLRAEGGLAGRFASAETNLAFLSPSLDYDAQEVSLTLTRNATDFEDEADTPDKPVAEVVDDPAEVPGLHEEVLGLTLPQAREAFERLSNSWAGSLQSMILDDSRFFREAVWAGVSEGAFGYGAALACTPVARAWSQAYFSSGTQDAWQGVPGMGRDVGGLVLGVDAPLSGGWRLGGVFGAQDTHARRTSLADRAHVQTVQAGVSLAGRWRGVRITAGAAHGWHTVDSVRDASVGAQRDTPRSRYQARSDQVFLEVMRPFALRRWAPASGAEPGQTRSVLPADSSAEREEARADAPAATLAPFARLAWVNLRVRGFDEQGGDAALSVAASRRSVGFSTLGLAFTHAVETRTGAARLQARLGWRRAHGAWQSSVTQRFVAGAGQRRFTSEGLPVARDTLALDLRVRARASRSVTVDLAYAGQFARGVKDHGLRLDGAWVF